MTFTSFTRFSYILYIFVLLLWYSLSCPNYNQSQDRSFSRKTGLILLPQPSCDPKAHHQESPKLLDDMPNSTYATLTAAVRICGCFVFFLGIVKACWSVWVTLSQDICQLKAFFLTIFTSVSLQRPQKVLHNDSRPGESLPPVHI